MYRVMTQTDGHGGARLAATFSTEDDALAYILSIGGDKNDTALVPNTDDEPATLVYNLSREEGCDIAWIEA